MSSPFPGMDPYIEDQGRWLDFHLRFVPYCCDALNDRLPEPYLAQLDEQLQLIGEDEGRLLIRPDVIVAAGGPRRDRETRLSGAALLEPQIMALPEEEDEVRAVTVRIVRLPEFRVVTVIEVLSPTNKGGVGYADYVRKRRALIRRDVNLVEIDLLLGGHRPPMRELLPSGDYFALVSRAEARPESEVYAWSIRDPLPTIPIPLWPPSPDVPLDLATVFAMAYERGRYARTLNYETPLKTPLADANREWVDAIVRTGRI